MPARLDRKAKNKAIAPLKRAWSVSDSNKPKKKIIKRTAPAGTMRKTKPTYEKMLVRALLSLDAVRKAVSFVAVRKWIEAKYPVPDNCTARLRQAANLGVPNGYFSVTPSSVRLTGKGKAQFSRNTRTTKRKSSKKAVSGSASPSPAASPLPHAPVPVPVLKKAPSKKLVLQKQASDAALALVLNSNAAAGLLSPKPKGRGATSKKQFIWQYEDGGRFHDYDGAASDIVEQCYQEYVANPHMMDVRAVKSGDWEYQVDFINLKQTNIQHSGHRVRNIRRIPNPYV